MDMTVKAVGVVRSRLGSLSDAPLQGDEGAPEAWLDLDPSVADAVRGIAPGDEMLVLTWLHQSRRDVLTIRPRGDATADASVPRPSAGTSVTDR